MRTSVALSALAALALSASATPSAASGVSPLVCPSGSTPANATNTAQYNVNVTTLLTIIGDFQNSAWQGLPQSAQTGPKNTPNSTRTAQYGPIALLEELVYIQANATNSEQVFQLANGPVTLSASPQINITHYLEDIRVSSSCNGSASSVAWTVDICYTSSPVVPASAISTVFAGAHTGALGNISTLLGIGNFTSCGVATAPSTAPKASGSGTAVAAGASGASSVVASASGTAGSAAAKPASGVAVRTSAAAGLLSVVGFVVLVL